MNRRGIPDNISVSSWSSWARNFTLCLVLHVLGVFFAFSSVSAQDEKLQAGAAVVDVTPEKFPIAVNGGFTAQFATEVHSKVKARAIVLSSGDYLFAIVVVDSCMLPRQLLDETKHLAQQATGIAVDNIMIAATHTHTAPAAMSCLGTDADLEYQAFLRIKIVEAIEQAHRRLQPARVGWGEINAANYMAIRRWILRSDRVESDPFGSLSVRANMHAGRDWDKVVGESGPEDPSLTMVAFQTEDGQPLAILSNLSMHYFSGQVPVSADYFGIFCSLMEQRLVMEGQANEDPSNPALVALMSHGCSGDVWRMDYTRQTPEAFASKGIDDYTAGLVDLAVKAYEAIEYSDEVAVDMAECRLPLRYRVPDAERLQWAQRILDEMGDRLPKTQEEVYAREQLYLHEMQHTEVVLQTLRLGEIGIATTPTETYALTGLKIKLQSPFEHTMVLDLANGGDGYIPPPEQHLLGGYNTWPARSAGLEVDAEPKIVESLLQMLERIAGQPRRLYQQSLGSSAKEILQNKPLAYFRMDEFSGSTARDSSGNGQIASYDPNIAFFLEGPQSSNFNTSGEINRCVHFTGGKLRVNMDALPEDHTVSMWIWNGMPDAAREISGWFYSRCVAEGPLTYNCERLGVDGQGHLMLQLDDAIPVVGNFKVERWTWINVRIKRTKDWIEVFVDDAKEPDIRTYAKPTMGTPATSDSKVHELFFGGSLQGNGWEGRMDEISIFAN